MNMIWFTSYVIYLLLLNSYKLIGLLQIINHLIKNELNDIHLILLNW